MNIEFSWLKKINLVIVLVSLFGSGLVASSESSGPLAADVQVTILSSNLANGATIGEWGFSALVEVDGNCILFDAGRYPDTVIKNAKV